MPLNMTEKKAIVADVNSIAAKSVSAVVAHYEGLTVDEMTEFRDKARNSGVYLRVVRNTLARRAVEETDFVCIKETLTGPVVLAFSLEEPSAAARLVRDFCKEHEKLQVKALVVSGKLLAADQLKAIADLPTYDEAVAMLMSVMQAPISKFVRTLSAVPTKLVRTVAAIRDQKQSAS